MLLFWAIKSMEENTAQVVESYETREAMIHSASRINVSNEMDRQVVLSLSSVVVIAR